MDELLNLAYEQLVQFKAIAPELMRKLIVMYGQRLGIYHTAWLIVMLMAVVLFVLMVVAIICKWGEFDGGWIVFLVLGCAVLLIACLMAIDWKLSIFWLETSPEIYILKKLAG